MATFEVSPNVRSHLRLFLTERFSLSELKNLSFDLGVDYEMFPHQTKGDLSRELVAYFERTQNLSCLVAEMVKHRPDEELVTLLAELGSCSPRAKVQIILPIDKLRNRKDLLSKLAQVLGVPPDEVMIIAMASGSVRLLVSLPAEAAERLVALNPERLGDAYEITSVSSYESLSPAEQSAWQEAALRGKPPTTFFGLSGGALVLAIAAVVGIVGLSLMALVGIGAVLLYFVVFSNGEEVTATEIVEVITPSATSDLSSTATPAITSTPVPTLTSLPTSTFTHTPTITPSPQPAREIFVSLVDGRVQRYDVNGRLQETFYTGATPVDTYAIGTGCAIDSSGNLYVTTFNAREVIKFEPTNGTYRNTGAFISVFEDGAPESIIFDAAGNAYVGIVGGDQDIRKFDASGNLIDQFNVDVESEDKGSDWIDLASDQRTIYYTSEGKRILRYDVDADRQLEDFTSDLPGETAYALRILPDGGVLVADKDRIVRLNNIGQPEREYDVEGEGGWFALGLDSNEESFWAGTSTNEESGKFYRFNIESGEIELGPIEVDSAPGGFCIPNEPTAALRSSVGGNNE